MAHGLIYRLQEIYRSLHNERKGHLPRTMPPFQTTKTAKRIKSATYGTTFCNNVGSATGMLRRIR